MSKNKSAPKSADKYIVEIVERIGNGTKVSLAYGKTQKDVKARIVGIPGRKCLFKISYDFYQELK
jgi:hypothetical protein